MDLQALRASYHDLCMQPLGQHRRRLCPDRTYASCSSPISGVVQAVL